MFEDIEEFDDFMGVTDDDFEDGLTYEDDDEDDDEDICMSDFYFAETKVEK